MILCNGSTHACGHTGRGACPWRACALAVSMQGPHGASPEARSFRQLLSAADRDHDVRQLRSVSTRRAPPPGGRVPLARFCCCCCSRQPGRRVTGGCEPSAESAARRRWSAHSDSGSEPTLPSMRASRWGCDEGFSAKN